MAKSFGGIVSRAIRKGDLVRGPCEVCGSPVSHAHHDDYAAPLVVRWLCPKHHKAWHAENGPGANLPVCVAIVDWRREHGLTQEKAARAAGVSVSGWRQWERNVAMSIPLDILRKIEQSRPGLLARLLPPSLDKGRTGDVA